MILKDTGGGDFAQCPKGSHIARCIKLIDIGTQKGEYEGKVTVRRQLIITWELPNELIPNGELEGKPFGVSRFYTASLGEKAALRKDLENWRGRKFTEKELSGFDPKAILGAPCMLSVVHTEKGKAKVAGVMSLPKGMTCPDAINPLVYFSLDEFDQDTYDGLSDGFKKLIQESPEFKELGKKEMADSSIPF